MLQKFWYFSNFSLSGL